MISVPLVGYVLRAAIRDKLFISLILMIALAVSLSLFLGSAAISEKDQFSIVFMASGLRIAGMMGLVLFCIFYVRRAFDNKDVEFILSRPVGRESFVISLAAAFTLLAFIVSLAIVMAVWLIVPKSIETGYGLWALSLFVEYIIMINMAFFFSMVLTSSTLCALGVFGFYVLARLIGQIMGTIDAGALNLPGIEIMSGLMEVVSIIIPRLDLIGQSAWLIYGVEDFITLQFIILQGLIFTGVLVTAAVIDLIRRQF